MVPKPHKSAQHKLTPSKLAGGTPVQPRVLTEPEVLEALRSVGAVSNGHFVLSSGRHSDVYAEKFRALEHPDLAASLGASLADRFAGCPVDVVLSPAVGAIILGYATALALSARFIFSERDSGEMRLRRGFSLSPGERVLVVEDVVTTGRSLKEVLALVDPGTLVGVGALLDRSSGAGADLGGVSLTALARLQAPTWDPSQCPLCAAGEPAVSPGSRHLTTPSKGMSPA
ncbi:MAG: orotate phosphoribosyltransferase [Actinomycetota bacterium]